MSAPSSTHRVAIIDRDSAFLTVLGKRLDAAGWQHRALGGAVPADELVAMKINALLVDLTVLPAEDAWPFLERVCGMMPGLGVIVCTTDSTVAQRVRGLRLGADDWIAKPCHPEEVMARIEAVVRRRRRASGETERGPTVVGELEIRPDQFQAFVGGASLDLTRREFELVKTLSESEGSVIERGEIYRRVWGYEMAHGDRSVDVFVRKLRAKIQKQSPSWSYIHTHFGIGYRFQPEPVDGLAPPPEASASAPAVLPEDEASEAPLEDADATASALSS
ncbi:MAG: response regulator transcription factor [Solirubrobacterales bacterium]|nr:response regulator transcription factor [Solirubrobacterales bacterium]